MQDLDKTKTQLIYELNEMRQSVAELQATQAWLLGTDPALLTTEERLRLRRWRKSVPWPGALPKHGESGEVEVTRVRPERSIKNDCRQEAQISSAEPTALSLPWFKDCRKLRAPVRGDNHHYWFCPDVWDSVHGFCWFLWP